MTIVAESTFYLQESYRPQNNVNLEGLEQEKRNLLQANESEREEIRRAVKMVMKGEIGHSVVNELVAEKETEIKKRTERINLVERQIDGINVQKQRWDDLRWSGVAMAAVFDQVRDELMGLNEEDRRQFLQASIENVQIEWKRWKTELRKFKERTGVTGPAHENPELVLAFRHYFEVEWDVEKALRWLEEKFGGRVKKVLQEVEAKKETTDAEAVAQMYSKIYGKEIRPLGKVVAGR